MADDPNVNDTDKAAKVLDLQFGELEKAIGKSTEQANEKLKETKEAIDVYKSRRDGTSSAIVSISILKAEIGGWAALAYEISKSMALNPEGVNFKSVFFLLKKCYETPSFEGHASNVQVAVTSWLDSVSGASKSQFMNFLFQGEGGKAIYQAHFKQFEGFEYKPGSEKQSEFYFDPKTWAGVSQALYQEVAWCDDYLSQLYANLLYYETLINQAEKAYDTTIPGNLKELLDDYKKKQEEIKEAKKNLEKQINDYQKLVDDWRQRLELNGDIKGKDFDQIEAEIRGMAYRAIKEGLNQQTEFAKAQSLARTTFPQPHRGPISNAADQMVRGGDANAIHQASARRIQNAVENGMSLRDFANNPLGVLDLMANTVRSQILAPSTAPKTFSEFDILETQEQKDRAAQLVVENYLTPSEAVKAVLLASTPVVPISPQLTEEQQLLVSQFEQKGFNHDQAIEQAKIITAKQEQSVPVDQTQNQSTGGPPMRMPQRGTLKSNSPEAQHVSSGMRSVQTEYFLRRAEAKRGLEEPSFAAAPFRRMMRGVNFARGLIFGGGGTTEEPEHPMSTPAIERAVSRSGMFGDIRNRISGKIFGSARNAIAKKSAAQAGAAIAGGAAKTAVTAGAQKAGLAAVAGGPVGIAIAVGSFLLSKENREKIKNLLIDGLKIGVGYIYSLIRGAMAIVESIAGPLGLSTGSATAFGAAAPGFASQGAFATAPAVSSTGPAAGLVGGAGGGGVSVFGTVLSSAPLIGISSVAATAVVITAVIIPAAFAQPPEAIEKYDPPKFTITKEIESVEVNGKSIDFANNKIPNIDASPTKITYKVTFTSMGEPISIIEPTDIATSYKASRGKYDITPGPQLLSGQYPTSLAAGESKSVELAVTINGGPGFIHNDSRVVNTISATGKVETDEKSTSQTQSATASLVIGNPIDGPPYGFPIAGKITSLDEEVILNNLGIPDGGCEPDHFHCGEMFASRKTTLGGLDIGIGDTEGVEAKSTIDGYVDVSSFDAIVGGKVVVVSLSGQYRVAFLHLADAARAEVGKEVKRGDVVGTVYSRSMYNSQILQASSGPHVHYQITSDGVNLPFATTPPGPCSITGNSIMSEEMNKVVVDKGSLLPQWVAPAPCGP